MEGLRYETIGRGYAATRREDPRLKRMIGDALGDALSLVNIGAGAGSYEPTDRDVIAIEPSAVMVAQRPEHAAPAIRAVASHLPLADKCVDAAMTVLSLHHWYPDVWAGVAELCRVARRRVVIATVDPDVSGAMWLMADYLPEVAALDHRIFPTPEALASRLGGETDIRTVPVAKDTPDWNLMSFWAHPERVLDVGARNATSGFARQSAEVVERVVQQVSRDLESGAWDARYGHLRALAEFDAGLRIIVGTPD